MIDEQVSTLTLVAEPAARKAPVHITPNLAGASLVAGVDDFRERLGWVALIYSTVYLIVHSVTTAFGSYSLLNGYSPALANTVASVCILAGIGVFALTRLSKLPVISMIWVALAFEVTGAAGIDLFLTWIPVSATQIIGLSWITVWIMCFGLVVRISPFHTVLGALAAASITPLMYGISVARGVSHWDPQTGFLLSFPNYVCAGIAYVSARIIYRMRQQVSEARAMGSYRLVEMLGTGGMGEVWLAHHQRLARPAAIKLIRPGILAHAHRVSVETTFLRFEREAQVTATLESSNTIRLYDYGVSDDGSFYYVMELLRGLDLQRLVARFGALPPARAVNILLQACHSLSEAHVKGLIHRDIKPANIYACRVAQDFDFVKVLDFGLVKPIADDGDEPGLTQAGTTTGTPAFMAPEQALGKEEVDARADIYSLGCVGYWLLTGKLVFPVASSFEMAMHHVQKRPVPPSEVVETEIPPELEHVILCCLAKDPKLRPQTMEELAQRLHEAHIAGWSRADARDWWRVNLPELSTRELDACKSQLSATPKVPEARSIRGAISGSHLDVRAGLPGVAPLAG